MRIDDLPQVIFHEYRGGTCAFGHRCDYDRCVDPRRPLGAIGLLLCDRHRVFLEEMDEANKTQRSLRLVK